MKHPSSGHERKILVRTVSLRDILLAGNHRDIDGRKIRDVFFPARVLDDV